MSSEVVIKAQDLGKCYPIFDAPLDRLKQMVMPRLQSAVGLQRRRYFREFWALRGVSFEVRQGETVGIIGRNGSGKSTLLQIVCGTLTPTVGEVTTKGRVAGLLELGAGFNPEFTGRENIRINAQILGLTPGEIDARFNDIVAFADIGDFLEQPVKVYSTGMFVRLAFAVQACIEPAVLIIDEAIAVGDAAFQAKCFQRLKDLKSRGTSVLFVSHDMAAVRTFCDRAIWIESGTHRAIGDVRQVTANYLETVFLSSPSLAPHAQSSSAESEEELARLPQPSSADQSQMNPSYDGQLGPAARPIARWGQTTGLIESIEMYDGNGRATFVVEGDDTIRLCIGGNLPRDEYSDGICVAFSIKTLSGLDLIVGVTAPIEVSARSPSRRFSAVFQFPNVLSSDRYMISVALQRGSPLDLEYIEHIEGFAFMQSVRALGFTGRIVPQIDVDLSIA